MKQKKEDIPFVAIIGRPNVGKSTLFNALIGNRKAITSDTPGTTRDSLIHKVEHTQKYNQEKIPYFLVDTAGLTNSKGEDLEGEVQIQAVQAMENADVIVFLVDGKKDLTKEDHDIVQILRKSKVPVLFVANKIDDGREDRVLELTSLGFGMPIVISAKNYTGIQEFEDSVDGELQKLGFERLENPGLEDEKDSPIKISFIGRPNVGKSSLLNRLLGQKRSIVSDVSGTTRDMVEVEHEEGGQRFVLTDSAGLRRRGKIKEDLDFWSSVRTGRAIEDTDVCILVIEIQEGVTHQDMTLIQKILDAGKGIMLCVNKWDLREEDITKDQYIHYLSRSIRFLPWMRVVFVSSKTGKGCESLFPEVIEIQNERTKRIPTSKLNYFVPEIYHGHVKPSVGTRTGNLKYATQTEISPPTFVFFVNNVKAFHWSYKRYIENKLREKYGFEGTPIRIELRDSVKEQFQKGKKRKR